MIEKNNNELDSAIKQEIMTDGSDKEMLKPEKEITPGVITELEKNEFIQEYGSLDAYLALKLLEVMETAVAPDNKGVLHTDYRTRLKTFELLLKLKDKNFDRNSIHLNFFSSPKKLRY